MLKVIAFENFVHFKDKQVINFETAKQMTKAVKRMSDGRKKTAHGISADTEGTAKEIPENKEDAAKRISDDTEKSAERIPEETEETAEGKSDITETKNKLNFFVGANFCGKSTVLELIRRCMTKEINVSVTSSFNEDKVAYVFCKFDLNSKEVISGVIKEGNRFHKILIYNDDVGKILRCNTFESSDSMPSESFSRFAKPGGEGDEDVLKHLFDKQKKESTYIDNILNKIQHKKKEDELDGKFLELDWKDLENTYVATMPLRGIGTVQWTKSNKIRDKENNYQMACERAEIISELLSTGAIDTDKEKKIFGYLTYPQKFEFKKDGDKIQVLHGRSDFPLLKTSEGILEAKQVSLLLAHKDFKTICLEEPDRGMHAQMIERLRAILYQEGWKKTIIVSTHCPYFIDTSTINNTHVFFRTESKDSNYSCNVRNVGLQKELSKVSDVETLRNLLFATKILLVEGPSDRVIVQALFTNLRESQQKIIGSKEESDITAYQIIPIGGCQNAKSVLKFCRYINLPSLCLLDRDKFVSIQYRQPIPKTNGVVECFLGMEKDKADQFGKKYVNQTESVFLEKGFPELADHLKEKKIFIWKYGAVEDAILSSEDMNKKIAESLNINLSDTTTRCKTLKSKLKERLDENERRLFSEHLSKVGEIKRFLRFMDDEENKRIQRFNVLSDSA